MWINDGKIGKTITNANPDIKLHINETLSDLLYIFIYPPGMRINAGNHGRNNNRMMYIMI